MDGAEHAVLAYLRVPCGPRTRLHSTNPLEWLNGEIKCQCGRHLPRRGCDRTLGGSDAGQAERRVSCAAGEVRDTGRSAG